MAKHTTPRKASTRALQAGPTSFALRLALVACVIAVLLALGAKPGGAASFSSSGGQSATGRAYLYRCWNHWFFKLCACGPCQTGYSLATTSGTSGQSAQSGSMGGTSQGGSLIDNLSFNHHHIATDYEVGDCQAGCTGCGGGSSSSDLPMLHLERRHRLRDQTWHSSFGPGVYSNYDTKLNVYDLESGDLQIDLFDPRELWPVRLIHDSTLAAGVFEDRRNKSVKEIKMIDTATGLGTNSIEDADKIELTNYQGYKFHFDLIEMSSFGANLVAHWKFEDSTADEIGPYSGTLHKKSGSSDPAYVTGYGGGKGLELLLADEHYMSVTPSPSNTPEITGTFTMGAWIKPNPGSTTRVVAVFKTRVNGGYTLQLTGSDRLQAFGIGSLTGDAADAITDDGNTWTHVAMSYDGETFRLFKNGQVIKETRINAQLDLEGEVIVGTRAQQNTYFFDGVIDDLKIYDGALTEVGVSLSAGLTPPGAATQKSGRLTKIEDRNGFSIDIDYVDASEYSSIFGMTEAESPELQWVIDTITDAQCRVADFDYHTTQKGGRWVVHTIELPGSDTRTITYTYSTDGKLTQVTHPDASVSNFTYGTSGSMTTVTYDEAAATDTHRVKTVYLSDQLLIDTSIPQGGFDAPEANFLLNQPSLAVRMITKPRTTTEDEVIYLNLPMAAPNASEPDWVPPGRNYQNESLIYEGSENLRWMHSLHESQNFKDGWTIDIAGIDAGTYGNRVSDAISGSLEGDNITEALPDLLGDGQQAQLGDWSKVRNAQGVTFSYTHDDDTFPTKKTYADGTSESWSYIDPDTSQTDPFHNVFRYRDRLNRVTRYDYDADGNMIEKEVGITADPTDPDDPADDTTSSEYASYTWAYYTANESPAVSGTGIPANNQFKGLLKASTDANSKTTHYVYNSDDLLAAVVEPADDPSVDTTRAVTLYTYDSAGRPATSTDPIGRKTYCYYDERDRVIQIGYHDKSTERYAYGTNNDTQGGLGAQVNTSNLVVAYQDRNGNVTRYVYDEQGRRVKTVTASHQIDPAKVVVDNSTNPTPDDLLDLITNHSDAITDASVRVEETCTFLDGTNLRATCTRRGETTTYTYDYRQRLLTTTVQPRFESGPTAKSLITTNVYKGNLLFSTTDPYGRVTYYGYRASDSALIRTVRATKPTAPVEFFANNAAVLAELRTSHSGANATMLITDYVLDSAGQQIASVDPRGVVHTAQYDSRGRVTQRIEAEFLATSYKHVSEPVNPSFGSQQPERAKTVTTYDANSNVTQIQSPRSFDTNDTEGTYAITKMEYTDRNLLESRTVAFGDANDAATEYFYYYLDRRRKARKDFRGNFTTQLWHECCGRYQGSIDPEGHGTISNTDFFGNVTHTATAADLAVTNADGSIDVSGSSNITETGAGLLKLGNAHDPPDNEDLMHEVTTLFDARNRPVARTVWLLPATTSATVDANSVPIAGATTLSNHGTERGAAGVKPASVLSLFDGSDLRGLTTRWLYDENLSDNTGLDNSTGVTVPELDGSGTFDVSVAALVTKLSDAGITFGSGSDGSAMVTINPEEEISAVIYDGTGRVLASGVFESYKNDTPGKSDGDLLTWTIRKYDGVTSNLLETIAVNALGNEWKSRSDGAGRVHEKVDSDGYVSTYTYDANSNVLSYDAPVQGGGSSVQVGWEAGTALGQFDGYDLRNRIVARTDAQGDTVTIVYDKHSNVVETYDAKNSGGSPTHWTAFTYDARDRRTRSDDRVASVTTWTYDDNNNLETMTDGDNQAGSDATVYVYDRRNLKTSVEYPGHSGASGTPNYDRREFVYDAARRLLVKEDQLGETVKYLYDLANRLTDREYRISTSDPLGTPPGSVTDTDTFTYDDASRMLTAISGRYNNTVTFTYDDVGRKESEKLTTNFNSGTQNYIVYSRYDDANRRTKIVYPDGSINGTSGQPETGYVERHYNDRNLLTKIDYHDTTTPTAVKTTLEDRTYFDDGRLKQIARDNNHDTDFTYRDDGLVSVVDHGMAAGEVGKYSYTYDANKNKLSEVIDLDQTTPVHKIEAYSFGGTSADAGYDAEDRLTSWYRDDGAIQTWTLSKTGNWTDNRDTDDVTSPALRSFPVGATGYINDDRDHNANHELTRLFIPAESEPDAVDTPGTQQTLEYDGKGNATRVPWLFSWPPSAAPRGDLTWDFDNQLKNYTLTVGPTTIDIDFRYDALGRRVSRDTNSYFGSEYYHRGDKVYVCDGDQVIAEYKPQTEGADAMHKYVYGTYVDEVCVFIDRVEPLASTLGSEEFRYYHRNNQYSVVALTDDTSTGVILERYTYNSYGVPMRLDPDGTLHGAKWYYSDVGNPYLFTGRRWDSWLGGMYYYRARYYSPYLGRFISRDPIEYADGPNMYQYVGGAPLHGLDPSGLLPPVILSPQPPPPVVRTAPVRAPVRAIRALPRGRAPTTMPRTHPYFRNLSPRGRQLADMAARGRSMRADIMRGRSTTPRLDRPPYRLRLPHHKPVDPNAPQYRIRIPIDLLIEMRKSERAEAENAREPQNAGAPEPIPDPVPEPQKGKKGKGNNKGQCACGWEKCDPNGDVYIDWEPSGKGSITRSECRSYCKTNAGKRKLVKYKWKGQDYDPDF